MAILADLFVATASEAAEYASLVTAANELALRFEPASHHGMTSLEFGTLWAVARGERWYVDVHQLEDVAGTAETWLCRFPDALVDRLAALEPPATVALAESWASTEEMSGAVPSELQPILDDLARLSRKAISETKGLYLWGRL